MGWSGLMGALSAGLTFIGTDGDMVLVFWAFVLAAVLTALIGPSIVGFFGGSDW